MSYAVIQVAGKQFKVRAGDTITTDKITGAVTGDRITVTDVLLVANGKDVLVGKPLVPKATVVLKVTTEQKGDKIRVMKYKSKSRYRKTIGHRQHQMLLEVLEITA